MNALERELTAIYKRLEDADRRLAASQMTGPVAEVRRKDNRQEIRIELAPEDPRTGKKFLSPWVQVQELAGGGKGEFSSDFPVAVGEQMRLLSPSGEIGPASLAIRDSHTNDNPNPSDDPTEAVIKKGATAVKHGADRYTIDSPEHLVKSDKINLAGEDGEKIARIGDLVHVAAGSSMGYWPIITGSEKVRAE